MYLRKKAPYIKPYKGYNQYNNRRLQYILISNDTPDYQRLYPFYGHYIIQEVETFRWW